MRGFGVVENGCEGPVKLWLKNQEASAPSKYLPLSTHRLCKIEGTERRAAHENDLEAGCTCYVHDDGIH